MDGWALQYPSPDADAVSRAARIRATHAVDDVGLTAATELALLRRGLSQQDARRLAALPLAVLLVSVASRDKPGEEVR